MQKNFFDDLRNQIDTESQIYMDEHKLEAKLKELYKDKW
jgi:hypothetical protein